MFTRRSLLMAFPAMVLVAGGPAMAQENPVISAREARDRLTSGDIVLVDIRTPAEWDETGIAEGAWPLDMRDPRFAFRFRAAMRAADGRPIALICATGGRSNFLQSALARIGARDILDVSEGMLGSRAGPGWIGRGYPVVRPEKARTSLPPGLGGN